jgi:hypothetical protein
MRIIYLSLLALAVVAAASVVTENDGLFSGSAADVLSEPFAGDEDELPVIEMVDASTPAGKSKQASAQERQRTRDELAKAFLRANLPTVWLATQEKAEENQQGSGYAEMKTIMIKVDELEKKIRATMATDLKYITEKRAWCARTRSRIEMDIKEQMQRIRHNNFKIRTYRADITRFLAGRETSRTTVGMLEGAISKVREERDADTLGYKKRLRQRLKEIKVLHACNMLVCTEFSDFKNGATCKQVLRDGTKTEESPSTVIKTPLRDLLKQAAEHEAKLKAEGAKLQTATDSKVKAGVAAETKKQSTVKLAKPSANWAATLQRLLQDTDLPPRTYRPARRVLALLSKAAVATATTAPAKATVAPTKTLKEMTLPESLVHLLQRVADDQKRETHDYLMQLYTFHETLKAHNSSVDQELTIQNDLGSRIDGHHRHIEASRKDSISAATERDALTEALKSHDATCRKENEEYAVRLAGNKAELVNMDKLRSLLRVLQTSDLPKCPHDCTSPAQGKCLWRGLYGKESTCACTDGWYGDACEKKKCPGTSGLLFAADERDVCSRRGKCNTKLGVCDCDKGYYHGPKSACEYKVCPGEGDCNRHGSCDKVTGVCSCFSKFYGSDCRNHKCPGKSDMLFSAANAAACNGNGACDYKTGKCGCAAGFAGISCAHYTCPNGCGGDDRGSCNSKNGTCVCKERFFGDRCQNTQCPNKCGGARAGRCDINTGVCTCRNGFSGPRCDAVSACSVETVNWTTAMTDSKHRYVWANCPKDSILVGLVRSSSDDTLRTFRYARCGRACEGDKPLRLGTCYVADWTRSFDSQGWSTCNLGFFVAGLLRSDGFNIYHIEKAKCCAIAGANGGTTCSQVNWWSCLDGPNTCTAPAGTFVAGFYRTAGQMVHNIEEARVCNFKRTGNSPAL